MGESGGQAGAQGRLSRLVSALSTARLLHGAIVFGVAFALLFAAQKRTVAPYGEGVVLFGAVRIVSGDVPYRDFYANYGPGQFYTLAGLFKLLGPSVLVARIWDVLVRALSVLAVYLIFVRLGARRMAVIAGLLSLIWLTALEFYDYPVFSCLAFSLLSIYCALPAYRGRRTTVPMMLSGAFIGLESFYRLDSGVMVALAQLATLGLLWLTDKPEERSVPETLVRPAASFVAGILVVAAPLWLLLLSAAPLHDVLRSLVVIPARIYRPMRSLPFPPLSGIADDLIHLRLSSITARAVYLPLFAVLLGGVVALAYRSSGRSAGGGDSATVSRDRSWRGVVLVLTCLSLIFFFKGCVRVSVIQMAPAILPALLIVCLVWSRLPGSRLVRALALLLTMYVILASASPVRRSVRSLIGNAVWYVEARPGVIGGQVTPARGDCHVSDGLERMGCFGLEPDQIDAIHYVQQRTADNERIFVGLTRHDKIVANNVLFYFASKRLSATKWHHFDPGVQTTAEIQAEVIADLEASRPRVVVLDSQWDAAAEPNDSRLSSGVTLLDDYLRARYQPAATFGGTTVELRRPPGE